MDEQTKEILDKFPFLTFGTHLDTPYLGIVQNCDAQLISIYVITDIPSEDMRKLFLELGDEYWWGSNRQIPINIFLKDRFKPFRDCLKHFSKKEFNVIAGPIVSLQETISKRVRKRKIILVKDI